MCALWLDDAGETKIVHMGSGSGSTMTCVLAHSGLDFLRLLATKYDEICRNEDFSMPPNGDEDDFLRIQTRNFSSEQRVSNDDTKNRVPVYNARLPR